MTAPRSRGVAPPAEAWDRAVAGIEAARTPDAWDRIVERSTWKADGHIRPLLDKRDLDWLLDAQRARDELARRRARQRSLW